MPRPRSLTTVAAIAVSLATVAILASTYLRSRARTLEVLCHANISQVRTVLARHVEDHGVLPWRAGADARRLLAEAAADLPESIRVCPAAPAAPEGGGYELAVRSPEAWARILRSDLGTACTITGGWPVAWCPGSPHGGSSLALTLGEYEALFEWIDLDLRKTLEATWWSRLSRAELARRNRLADALAGPGGLSARLEGGGLFDWGYAKRVAPAVRRGLGRIALATPNSIGVLMVPVDDPGGTVLSVGVVPVPAHVWADRGLEPAEPPERRGFVGRLLPRLDLGVAAPRVALSPREASALCDRLTARELEAGSLPADRAYRLPTVAEWQRLALAGGEGPYPHGSTCPAEGETVVFPYGLINAWGIVAWLPVDECCTVGPEDLFATAGHLAGLWRGDTRTPLAAKDTIRSVPPERRIEGLAVRLVLARP